jgi:histidinol-phosphate aminotransferase
LETAKSSVGQSIRPVILSLAAYHAGPTLQEIAERYHLQVSDLIKLDANEHPYGMPPHAAAALRQSDATRYPDAAASVLRAALASYTGIPAEHIVVGDGSDELLHLLCFITLEPGDEVITCEPTFSVYALCARQCGARVISLQRDEHFDIVPSQLLEAVGPRTKLIFLCSPNNPTGNPLPLALVEQALSLGKLVVVDEAYIEFGGEPVLPLFQKWPNLLVLRTFSKFFGLAGLRVGYGLFPPELAEAFHQVRAPFNVNRAAQDAALAALNEDLPLLLERRDELLQERERLYQAISHLPGFRPFPSQGNFLLIQVEQPLEAHRAIETLAQAGILVRTFSSGRLRDSFRLTIGTFEQNERVLVALSQATPDPDK